MGDNRRKLSQKVLFDQGTGPGQLLSPAKNISPASSVPGRIAVGPAGEISIMEPGLDRIQGFNPEGKFLSALTIDNICKSIGITKDCARVNLFNVFSKGSYVGVTLVQHRASGGSSNEYWLLTYRVDTAQIVDRQKIAALPPDEDWVSMSFLDDNGYLWVFTDQWFVFGPTGQRIAVLGAQGSYVDRKGCLYIGGDTMKIKDRSGRIVEILTIEPATSVEIDGGDPDTFLFSWERNLDPIITPQMATYRNVLNLYQIMSNTKRLVLRDRIELPSTRLRYPNPNVDFVVPIENYLKEMAVVRGNYFYILAYSNEKYWIDISDLSSWLRP